MHDAYVAQLVEQCTRNAEVAGSIPAAGSPNQQNSHNRYF